MPILNRTRRCPLRRNALKNFKHRIAVPSLALKRPPKLIGNASRLRLSRYSHGTPPLRKYTRISCIQVYSPRDLQFRGCRDRRYLSRERQESRPPDRARTLGPSTAKTRLVECQHLDRGSADTSR